jgi:hypothetical protein
MNRFQVFQRYVGVTILFSLWLSSAGAAEVSIQASFKPDSANPQRNKFKNDTPSSGYCGSYPAQCQENAMFS